MAKETIFEKDTETLNKKTLEVFETEIKALLKEKGEINIGIPGGNSVKGLFTELKFAENINWEDIKIFLADERLVDITHPESNYRNAHSTFISRLTEKEILPEENVHAFFVQDFKGQAKRNYEREIEDAFGVYDLILLGVGEDGHIASLFPNHPALDSEEEYTILIDDAPKEPRERITISPKMIAKAKVVMLFFIGENKKEAYENFKNSKISEKECPAKLALKAKKTIVITNLE